MLPHRRKQNKRLGWLPSPRPYVYAILIICLLRIAHYFGSQLLDGDDNVTSTTAQLETKKILGQPLPPECDGSYYKVVEIGTSNFNTHIQMAKPQDTGLSVDAMKVYIDQLPELKCWRKINRAVVARREDVPNDGLLPTYFIPYDIIQSNPDFPQWLRGCNSVGRPHPTAKTFLKKRNLLHYMKNLSVPVNTVEDLLDSSGACQIGTFKVDVEGMDGELLVAFAAWVEKHNRSCFAREVVGEFNELSNGRTSFAVANETLARAGYKLVGKGGLDRKWTFQ